MCLCQVCMRVKAANTGMHAYTHLSLYRFQGVFIYKSGVVCRHLLI